jgi:DNA processing protein
VIISGLASGIDYAAHSSCLANNGNTIAVLAHGLHMIYPSKNTALVNSILDNGGLWISEHPFGTEPKKHLFVLRNRIQVGLSMFSIIVEAKKKSGTMSHADFCLKATAWAESLAVSLTSFAFWPRRINHFRLL